MLNDDVTVQEERAQFLRDLCAAGLLIDSGVQGVYGHGADHERIRGRLTALIGAMAEAEGAWRLSFPPVLPRHELETSGYLGNFPQLAGSIFGFAGSEADGLLEGRRAAAHEDWSAFQAQTELMMLPAACYPAYPALAARGPLGEGGAVLDLGACWVFRHEPSPDPARQQIFQVHELIRIGAPEEVTAWRARWAKRGLELFGELGLDARMENASDPFFGRHGRLLAASQSAEDLKWELLVPITGTEPTACASFNRHVDHFAELWGLRSDDGGPIHTACAGFGLDRTILALLRTHGLEPEGWPVEVRRLAWD